VNIMNRKTVLKKRVLEAKVSRPKEDRELCEDMEGIVCCVDFDVIHA